MGVIHTRKYVMYPAESWFSEPNWAFEKLIVEGLFFKVGGWSASHTYIACI